MTKTYLIPLPGISVYDPQVRDFLPPEGREVEENTYWKRRIKDGDVTVGKTPKVVKDTINSSKKGA